jgi:hypothetical protein
MHFIGPIPDGCEVAHYPDGNTKNNSVTNLQIVTRAVNMSHKREHGTVPERGTARFLGKERAQDVRYLASLGIPLRQIAEKFGIRYDSVRRVVKGETYVKRKKRVKKIKEEKPNQTKPLRSKKSQNSRL